VLGPDQIEQQRGNVGVGQNCPGGNLLAGGQADGTDAFLTNQNALDPRAEAKAPTVGVEAGDQRLGDRPGSALGYSIATCRGGHTQHESQRGTEPVVGPHIHMKCEGGKHPSGFRASKPAF
jgi:hypothetical protein